MNREQLDRYERVIREKVGDEYNIKTLNGQFGAHMNIKLINDGPVTIMLESKEK